MALAAPPPLPALDTTVEFLAILEEVAPHLKLLKAPETSSDAPVVILTFDETADVLLFLQHLAAAITLCLGIPCHLLPGVLWKADKASKNLLLLASAHSLPNVPTLSSIYREDTKRGLAFLAKTALLPLPDLSLQMRRPTLKAALWQSICQAVARHVRR